MTVARLFSRGSFSLAAPGKYESQCRYYKRLRRQRRWPPIIKMLRNLKPEVYVQITSLGVNSEHVGAFDKQTSRILAISFTGSSSMAKAYGEIAKL